MRLTFWRPRLGEHQHRDEVCCGIFLLQLPGSVYPNMIPTKMALSLIVFIGAGRSRRRANTCDLGTNAPTPGTNDIAQLSVVGNQTAPDG